MLIPAMTGFFKYATGFTFVSCLVMAAVPLFGMTDQPSIQEYGLLGVLFVMVLQNMREMRANGHHGHSQQLLQMQREIYELRARLDARDKKE